MTTISIAESLWIEETPMGATLNFRVGEGRQEVLFRVGISHDSLMTANRALSSPSCLWTIADGSLTMYGDQEAISLTFCALQNEPLQAGLSLFGEELAAFRTAVYACACRRESAIN